MNSSEMCSTHRSFELNGDRRTSGHLSSCRGKGDVDVLRKCGAHERRGTEKLSEHDMQLIR